MAFEEQISLGFFPDFHDPTVLFWGSSEALEQLAAFLRGMASQGKERVFLSEENWINPRRGIRIRLELSQPASGMSKATDAAEAHAVLARLEPLLSQAKLAEGEVE